MNTIPKIILHDRPYYLKRCKAVPTVFCWYYSISDNVVYRIPVHMKKLRQIPGVLVERTWNRLKSLMESKGFVPC